jgi:hypothetical protein
MSSLFFLIQFVGVGGEGSDVVRVSELCPDVTAAEVNLILWLLVEREFKSSEANATNETDSTDASAGRIQHDSGGDTFRPTVTGQAKRCKCAQVHLVFSIWYPL